MRKSTSSTRAIALVELMVAVAAGSTVMLAIAYFMSSGAVLFAKNVSTNLSHNSLRTSLDKLVQAVDQASGSITQIDTAGQVVSVGSSAGIYLDQYLGGPYVVTHPGGSGLSASATNLTLTRWVPPLMKGGLPNPEVPLAVSPYPVQGDVVEVVDSTARLRVQSATSPPPGVDSSERQTFTVTLQSGVGQSISWDSNTVKTAHLKRRVAFVVVPAGARNELRYYHNAETVADFANSTDYFLLTNNIGTGTGDSTPFAKETVGGHDFLSVVMRVRAGQYANRLSTQETNNFSTIERVQLRLAPKGS